MKYLWVLFIFLCAFAGFVTYIVIADGDIESLLNPELSETSTIQEEQEEKSEYFEETTKLTEFKKIEKIEEETQIFISVFNAKTDNLIDLISLEEYLCGVVFSEMPSNFELEALKAQAVAARSFCVYKMLYSTDEARIEHHGADICNDYNHCKDYISYDEACEKYGEDYINSLWEKIKNAVDSTKDEIITYKSEPAIAVFHAISGKETESAENIWGNHVPYLVSVSSEEENRQSEVKNYITENIFETDEFKEKLLLNGFRIKFTKEPEFWIDNIKLNSSGRVDSIDICGKSTTGRRLREIFSLRSTNFTLEYKNQSFVFTVTGYGHGVGM